MNEQSPINALEFNAVSVKLGRSFLLFGSDAYLIDLVLNKLKNELRANDAVDITLLYGDEVKSSILAEHLDAFSIFSSSKLIILRNAEALDKKELEVLGDYFDAPSDIQTVAIVTDKIDARLSSWKKIKSNCLQILCEPPKYGGLMRAWLDAELKKLSKRMTPKAIEEFINRIELDYYSAANELNKIDLLTLGRSTITEIDVLKSLGTSRTGTLIDFYRALGKRQLKLSMEALGKMLSADWEPLQVFAQISKLYLVLWRILLLKKAHVSDSEILNKHMPDIFQSQRKEYLDFSRQYNLRSLEAIFAILLETDAHFKLSVAEPEILLSRCLIRLLEA